MNTLAKIDIQDFTDNYPNPDSISDFSDEDLEKYIAELLKVSKEFGSVKRFPGGVNGYTIFLMLANTTRISSMKDDFECFTFEDLNIYKSAYQALYNAVKERFENVFKNA